ncbi:MAG: hypothetical protein H7145_16010 [Akkermansiaceae bacterium]|nr:hypothetical protein [Armatimonadota bacterium]
MDWNRLANEATHWCLQTLWDREAKRFRPASPMAPKDVPWDFMWGNGVAFSMLVGATRFASPVFRPYLDRFWDGMEGYWDLDKPVPAYDAFLSKSGDDKYFDDNEWMVLTFVEAYELTRNIRYLVRAEEVLRYVLSGWDDKRGGGIYWREDRKSKNTCSNGPGAVAVLVLARHGKSKERVEWARRIINWTRKTLQDPSDGLYWDNINISTGAVEKTKWTYNSALMLRAHLALWQLTQSKADLDEAVRIAESSERVFVAPGTGAFRDEANFTHLLVEAYLLLWRETKLPWLKARAEANGEYAAFQLKYIDGGYRTSWKKDPPVEQNPRKTLMANASTARLFWCLAQIS